MDRYVWEGQGVVLPCDFQKKVPKFLESFTHSKVCFLSELFWEKLHPSCLEKNWGDWIFLPPRLWPPGLHAPAWTRDGGGETAGEIASVLKT